MKVIGIDGQIRDDIPMKSNEYLKICGIELGPWEKGDVFGRDEYERFVVPKKKNFRDVKIRVWKHESIWGMHVWDELRPIKELTDQWLHTTIGEVDHRIVLDAADVFLERVEKLRSFE